MNDKMQVNIWLDAEVVQMLEKLMASWSAKKGESWKRTDVINQLIRHAFKRSGMTLPIKAILEKHPANVPTLGEAEIPVDIVTDSHV